MQPPLWLKIAGLAATGAATMVATAALMRPAPATAKAETQVKPGEAGTLTITVGPTTKGAPPPSQPWRPAGPSHVAHAHMEHTDIAVEGNLVHVKAQGFIFERRPNQRYIWSLRIHDLVTNNLISKHDYIDQPFTVDGERSPTFEDTITLQPGSYRVCPVVVEITGITDPKQLDDMKALTPVTILGGGRTVRIP